MMSSGDVAAPAWLPPAVMRAIGFFALWVILSGDVSGDLLPGILTALAATGISLALLPGGGKRVRLLASIKFAIRLLRQSITAGADVARRALDPQLPLNPGLIYYRTGLPPGPARNIFTTLMSLLPGTVPIRADANDRLIVHCLDAGQPIAAQLAAEEALLGRAAGRVR